MMRLIPEEFVGTAVLGAKHDTPVPIGWSTNNKLESLAQVYLLSSTEIENIFFSNNGPTSLKLLNMEDAPGPPPRTIRVGKFLSYAWDAPILPKNIKPSADPFFPSTLRYPLLITPLYLYSSKLGFRHTVSILQ